MRRWIGFPGVLAKGPSRLPARIGAVLITLLVAGASLQIGCTYSQRNVTRPDVLSPTFAPMVFKEEGELILLTVSVNATRFHADDAFIPLEIWVANKGVSRSLRVTRESFYLTDAFGRRYGMASVDEVRRLQTGLSQDRRLNSSEYNSFKFSAYRYIPSRFFPVTGGALLRDRVELPRFAFMADMFYFPRPEGELRGGVFELHLKTKELDEEVFIVFEVPH
jgi:hypothetical protein